MRYQVFAWFIGLFVLVCCTGAMSRAQNLPPGSFEIRGDRIITKTADGQEISLPIEGKGPTMRVGQPVPTPGYSPSPTPAPSTVRESRVKPRDRFGVIMVFSLFGFYRLYTLIRDWQRGAVCTMRKGEESWHIHEDSPSDFYVFWGINLFQAVVAFGGAIAFLLFI